MFFRSGMRGGFLLMVFVVHVVSASASKSVVEGGVSASASAVAEPDHEILDEVSAKLSDIPQMFALKIERYRERLDELVKWFHDVEKQLLKNPSFQVYIESFPGVEEILSKLTILRRNIERAIKLHAKVFLNSNSGLHGSEGHGKELRITSYLEQFEDLLAGIPGFEREIRRLYDLLASHSKLVAAQEAKTPLPPEERLEKARHFADYAENEVEEILVGLGSISDLVLVVKERHRLDELEEKIRTMLDYVQGAETAGVDGAAVADALKASQIAAIRAKDIAVTIIEAFQSALEGDPQEIPQRLCLEKISDFYGLAKRVKDLHSKLRNSLMTSNGGLNVLIRQQVMASELSAKFKVLTNLDEDIRANCGSQIVKSTDVRRDLIGVWTLLDELEDCNELVESANSNFNEYVAKFEGDYHLISTRLEELRTRGENYLEVLDSSQGSEILDNLELICWLLASDLDKLGKIGARLPQEKKIPPLLRKISKLYTPLDKVLKNNWGLGIEVLNDLHKVRVAINGAKSRIDGLLEKLQMASSQRAIAKIHDDLVDEEDVLEDARDQLIPIEAVARGSQPGVKKIKQIFEAIDRVDSKADALKKTSKFLASVYRGRPAHADVDVSGLADRLETLVRKLAAYTEPVQFIDDCMANLQELGYESLVNLQEEAWNLDSDLVQLENGFNSWGRSVTPEFFQNNEEGRRQLVVSLNQVYLLRGILELLWPELRAAIEKKTPASVADSSDTPLLVPEATSSMPLASILRRNIAARRSQRPRPGKKVTFA